MIGFTKKERETVVDIVVDNTQLAPNVILAVSKDFRCYCSAAGSWLPSTQAPSE